MKNLPLFFTPFKNHSLAQAEVYVTFYLLSNSFLREDPLPEPLFTLVKQ